MVWAEGWILVFGYYLTKVVVTQMCLLGPFNSILMIYALFQMSVVFQLKW